MEDRCNREEANLDGDWPFGQRLQVSFRVVGWCIGDKVGGKCRWFVRVFRGRDR